MGRAPQISREAVLAAALRLADEQGLDAVTMHAVARRLQVTPMALYRHVDDKNALLDGLVEVLLTEYPPPRAEGEWDQRLTALADGVRDTARRHPAVFPLLLTRPAVTPAARVVRDAVQAALREGGLQPAGFLVPPDQDRAQHLRHRISIGPETGAGLGPGGASAGAQRSRRR